MSQIDITTLDPRVKDAIRQRLRAKVAARVQERMADAEQQNAAGAAARDALPGAENPLDTGERGIGRSFSLSMLATAAQSAANIGRAAQSGAEFFANPVRSIANTTMRTAGQVGENMGGSVGGIMLKDLSGRAMDASQPYLEASPKGGATTLVSAAGGALADYAGPEAQQMQAAMPRMAKVPYSREWFAAGAGALLPQVIGSAAATTVGTVAGGPVGGIAAGIAVNFPLEAGSQAESIYQDLIAKGVPKDDALAEAFVPMMLYGAGSAAIEQAGGAERLIQTGALKNSIKETLKKIPGMVVQEAIEEPLQGNLGRQMQRAQTGGAERLLSRENLSQSGQESALGGMGGLMFGGGMVAGQMFRGREDADIENAAAAAKRSKGIPAPISPPPAAAATTPGGSTTAPSGPPPGSSVPAGYNPIHSYASLILSQDPELSKIDGEERRSVAQEVAKALMDRPGVTREQVAEQIRWEIEDRKRYEGEEDTDEQRASVKAKLMRGETLDASEQAILAREQQRFDKRQAASPQEAAKMGHADWQKWAGARRHGSSNEAMDIAAAAILRGDKNALAAVLGDIDDLLMGEVAEDATPEERADSERRKADWQATRDAITDAERSAAKTSPVVGRLKGFEPVGRVVDLGGGVDGYTSRTDADELAKGRNERRRPGDPLLTVVGGVPGSPYFRIVEDPRRTVSGLTQGSSGQEGTPADYSTADSLNAADIFPRIPETPASLTVGQTGPAFRRKGAELTVSAGKKEKQPERVTAAAFEAGKADRYWAAFGKEDDGAPFVVEDTQTGEVVSTHRTHDEAEAAADEANRPTPAAPEAAKKPTVDMIESPGAFVDRVPIGQWVEWTGRTGERRRGKIVKKLPNESAVRVWEPGTPESQGVIVSPNPKNDVREVDAPLPDTDSGDTITKEPADVPNDADKPGRGQPGSREGVSGGVVGSPEQPAAPGAPVQDQGDQEDQDGASGSGDAVPGGGRKARGQGSAGRSGRGVGSRGGTKQPAPQPDASPDGDPVRPGARAEGEGVAPVPRERPKDLSARNHLIGTEDEIAPAGEKGKVRANLAAIRLLKKLEEEGRNASPEEKKVLAKYTAWGGVASALDSIKGERWREWLEREASAKADGRTVPEYYRPDEETQKWAKKWYTEYAEVREMMSREEFRDSQETTQYAHYTSRDVITRAIWPIVERLGFKGGAVLESSAGIGHMIGLQPATIADKSFWVAVEKDAIPARILAKLYPETTVLPQPFENAKLKAASFDLVVGNVPFARSGPSDKRYPKFSLHNYFLARSIDLLRPNGLMVVITSRSTLDEPTSAEFREWAAGRADLVGAIRLPQTAFMANANTKVTTDILIFRKRDGAGRVGGKEWVALRDVEVPNTTTGGKATTKLNEYYVGDRSMMLGELVVGRGLYTDEEPMLRAGEGDMAEALAAAVEKLPKDIAGEGLAGPIEIETTGEGSFKLDDKGAPYQVVEGKREYLKPKDAAVAKAYIPMANKVLDVYRMQVDPEASDRSIEAARKEMRGLYQAFQKSHGRINEHFALLSGDPDYYRVAALEVRNRKVEKTQRNTKRGHQTIFRYTYTYTDSDVLTKRTQYPSLAPTKADSIEDAIAISEAWRGGFDTAYMAKLLQRPEEEVRKDLVGTANAFLDPSSGLLVSRDEYLSGNIKKKIEIAKAAGDPAFDANVKAMESVLPKRVSIPSVSFGLGAQWIPPSVYTGFAAHLLGPRHGMNVSYNEITEELSAGGARHPSQQDREMGGGGMSATELLASKINLSPIRITKEVPSDTTKSGFTTVTDTDKTSAAMFKADQLERQFIAWAKSSDVALQIEDRYNELFNASVNRSWTAPKEGSFPGAAAGVTLRPHQARAVVRGLRESYLNANEVGTGKTYIIVTTAMEQRRLGLARKPLVVVQNSTLPQVADSFARLYPSARVLVPSRKDFEPQNRKRLLNLIASNDWDAVILPQSQFNLLPNRTEREKSYVLDQIDALEDAIRDEGADPDKIGRNADPKVKAMGRRLKSLREFYDKLMARKIDTSAMPFEDLGVDSLLVDEAHAYKKLAFITRLDQVKGVDTGFSQRGLTLYMKTRWVHERRGGKNVILFTGTPITNTLAEAWTMMRYVRPDLLAENHVTNFDQFVTTYGERSTEYELVAGVKLKQVERIRRFSNIPEFQRLWLQAVDEVRAKDVGIPRPPIKGGGRSVVVLKPSSELLAYMQRLLARYEWFENLTGKARFENKHVPGVINSLARAAAIDLRLVVPGAADDKGSKLNAIVEDVYKRWQEHQDSKLTQAVIIDRFQRGDRGDKGYFNCFDDIRDKLIARGVPADEIASVNDSRYDDAEKRGPLFEAVNQGSVRIVMGSTERLGVGVNIQERLAALYHGDVPARPADMEQREGRINRQGNRVHADFGVEPEIIAYGVEKSFDSGGFERLARKQQMQDDARSGKFMGRSIEDDADDVFSYADAAATLTGDPDFKRRAELETRVRELAVLEEEYQRFSIDARRKIQYAEKNIPVEEAKVAELEGEVRSAAEAAQKAPELEIQGRSYATPEDIKEAMATYVERVDVEAKRQADKYRTYFNGPRLTLNGIDFKVTVGAKLESETDFTVEAADSPVWKYFGGGVTTANGIFGRMYETLQNWSSVATLKRDSIKGFRDDIRNGNAFLAKPFEYTKELEKARADLGEVTARLIAKANTKAKNPADPHGAPDLNITMDDGAPPPGASAAAAPSTGTTTHGASGALIMPMGERSDSGLEARLTRMIEGAQKRMRQTRIGRGRNVGSTTLGTDIYNSAIIAAGKAALASVRGGKKLTAIVNEVLADFPSLLPYAGKVRSVARQIIKDAETDPEGLEGVAATLHADFEKIRDRKRARGVKKRAAAAAGIAPQDDDAKALADSLSKAARIAMGGYRVGMKEGMERVQGKMDKIVAALRNRERTLEQRRATVLKMVEEFLPLPVRGKFLHAINGAKTPAQVMQAVRRVLVAMSQYRGRELWAGVVKWAQEEKISNLTQARRVEIRGILRKAHAAREFLKDSKQTTVSLAAQVMDLEAAYRRIREIYAEHAAENTQLKVEKLMMREDAVSSVVANVEKTRADRSGGADEPDPDSGWKDSAFRSTSDVSNTTAAIEGRDDAILKHLMYDRMVDATELKDRQNHGDHEEIDRLARAAGFKGLNDMMAKMGPSLGEAEVERMTVTIGGQEMSLSLGHVFDIAAMDAQTKDTLTSEDEETGAPVAGVAVNLDTAKAKTPIRLTLQEANAIAAQFEARAPGLVAGIKARLTARRDPAFKVARRLNGWEPEKLPDYWPRARNMKQAPEKGMAKGWKGLARTYLENLGLLEAREESKTALLVRNGLLVALEHLDNLAKLTHLAEPTRNADMVLSDPRVLRAITARWGKQVYGHLEDFLAAHSQANETRQGRGKFARGLREINANLAVSNLGGNISSMLKQVGGIPRLIPIMGWRAFNDGIRGIGSIDMAGMSRESGYLWKRYLGGGFGRFSALFSDATVVDDAGVGRAMKAMWANAKAGEFRGVYRSWRSVGQAVMKIYNWWDSLPARVAWAGYTAQVNREHPEMTEKQKTRWVVMQVDAAVRQTQNAADTLDMPIMAINARDSAAASLFLFTSDRYRAGNRIRQAFKRSRREGWNAAAAEAFNIAWGTAVGYGFATAIRVAGAAAFGDDDEYQKALEKAKQLDRAALTAASDALGLLDPILFPNILRLGSGLAPGNAKTVDIAALSTVNDALSLIQGAGSAIRGAADDSEKTSGFWRFVKALDTSASAMSQILGNPLHDPVRRIRQMVP